MFNLDFRIYEWLENINSIYAWILRIFIILVGVFIWVFTASNYSTEEQFDQAIENIDYD